MSKIRKIIASILMATILSFSMTVASGMSTYSIAEAAVKAPTVASTSVTLFVGNKDYKISIKYKAAKASVSFQSSNKSIAAVTKDGTVKPLAAGKAIITANVKQNGKTYSLKVTVTVSEPYIELTESSEYLNIGETFIFKAKTYGLNEKVTWSVSDDTVASISKTGKLTTKAAGEVTVTAVAGDTEAVCNMTVGSNRLGTFSRNISCYKEQQLYITIYDPIEGEKLHADTMSGNQDIISFKWNEQKTANVLPITITPQKEGADTLVIESNKSGDRLYIHVTATEKEKARRELSAKEIYA